MASSPTRIFRADTLADVASAAIVASTLPPGRDILLFSTDKSYGSTSSLVEQLKCMASVHPWSAVVDVSGWPDLELASRGGGLRSRHRAVLQTRAAVRDIRRRLSPLFGLDPDLGDVARNMALAVDELYLTCLHHPDIQAINSIFPAAKVAYSPHGFDSLNASEIRYYARYCQSAGVSVRLIRDRSIRLAKSIIFGPDAVLPSVIDIEVAYSFNAPMPWARRQVSLRDRLDRAAIGRFYRQLPAPVRGYYDGLAAMAGDMAALLLFPPFDYLDPEFTRMETGVFVDFASRLIAHEHLGAIIIKPHPRNSRTQIEETVGRIQRQNPATQVHLVEEFSEYPVEIVLFPFAIRTCGGLTSSSIRTLHRIYGLRAYCPEQDLLRLYSSSANELDAIKVWIEDNKQDYIPI